MSSAAGNVQDKKASGSSKLSPPELAVMRTLMEPREMPYKKLCETLLNLPEGERVRQEEIDGTLQQLLRKGYVVSFVEGGDVIYLITVDDFEEKPKKDDEMQLRSQSVRPSQLMKAASKSLSPKQKSPFFNAESKPPTPDVSEAGK